MNVCSDTLEAMLLDTAAVAAVDPAQLTNSMTKVSSQPQATAPSIPLKDRPIRPRPVATLDTSSKLEALPMVASQLTAVAMASKNPGLRISTSAHTCQHRTDPWMLPVVAAIRQATKAKGNLTHAIILRARCQAATLNPWIPSWDVVMPTQRPAAQITAIPLRRLPLTTSMNPSTISRSKPPLPVLLLPLPPAHRLRQETAVDRLTRVTIATVTNGIAATASQTDTAVGHNQNGFTSNDV